MIDGKRLKQLRQEHNYSAKQLGEKLGYSETTVYRWEKDNSLCDIDIIHKLAELFGVAVSFILGEDSETAFANAVTEEKPEREEIAFGEVTAEIAGKPVKKQLSLVKIGAITAASTFALFAIVTAIIILCVYFQPNTYDGENFNVITNNLEIVVIICIMLASVLLATTATILSFYFIRKRRK